MTQKHLYLIDGSGFIFRAFHALPPLARPDGVPINAVLGFTNMLIKLLDQASVDYLAVVFDSARRNFRHDLYPDYKGDRPEVPEELIPQFPLIRQTCKAFNVPTVEQEGYEADDLIATYATWAEKQDIFVTIVSSDKDLMQLITPRIEMLDPLKNRRIGSPEVIEKFGVPPEKVVEVQSLIGDKSDNIPGVPGIGVKTAAELIQDYGTLENLLKHLEDIKQPKRRQALLDNQENARLSYKLATLERQVPLTQSIEDFTRKSPDPDTLRTFLETQNFQSLLTRLETKGLLKGPTPLKTQGKTQPLEKNYELILKEADLERWIREIQRKGQVAFDTETTSLNPLQAELVGISLALEPGKACYIPLGHKSGQKSLFESQTPLVPQLPLNIVLSKLKLLLEDPSILKIGQNIKYDMLVLSQYEIELQSLEDTMVLSYDLDNTKNRHNMDLLAELHLGYKTLTYEEVTGTGKDQITFDYVPLDKALLYAAEDADITLQLYQLFKTRLSLEQATTLYETIDRPLIPVLVKMEKTGVKVDIEALQILSKDFEERLGVLEKEIYQLVGHSFNIGSPKQLGEILFEEMSLEGGVKGKSGSYNTNSEVLEKLAAQGHTLPEKVIEWRQLSKLKSTYTDALAKSVNPKTGRVHTSYSMTVTSTGRLSSSEPNLQNIPIRTEEGRKIRKAFVAKPGCQLLSLDYSQIELRILAHMAQVHPLLEAFRNQQDIHATTASEVFGVPLDQVTSEYRRRAKAINFGIIYGMSDFGLARQLKIPQYEAKKYIEFYHHKYPEIFTFMEGLKEKAKKQGYVETLFGRRCYIQGILDRNPAQRNFAERQAINAPLQGTAADIIKRAMIRIPQAFKDAGLTGDLLLQVHDELVFEVPERELEKTTALARSLMEEAASLSIPLLVDINIGPHWGKE